MAGLLVTAEPFILTVYGEKWAGVVPILQILCLTGINQSVMTTVGWIYTALGRTDLMFKWGMFSGVMVLASFWIGLRWGVLGVAWAYVLVSYVVLSYPGWAVPGRLVGITVGDMLRNLAPVFWCTAAMAGMVAGVGWLLPKGFPQWAALLVQVPIGITTYWLLISRFRIAAYGEIWELLSERVAAIRSAHRAEARSVTAEPCVFE
jgi:PST family polysaccharide transporter